MSTSDTIDGVVSFCPRCGSDDVDVYYDALLTGPGGAYREPACKVKCNNCARKPLRVTRR